MIFKCSSFSICFCSIYKRNNNFISYLYLFDHCYPFFESVDFIMIIFNHLLYYVNFLQCLSLILMAHQKLIYHSILFLNFLIQLLNNLILLIYGNIYPIYFSALLFNYSLQLLNNEIFVLLLLLSLVIIPHQIDHYAFLTHMIKTKLSVSTEYF